MTATHRGLYIPSLDGLRCVAIALVFASHAMMASGIARFVPGHFGVTLFFFLSGYLITTLMRQEVERTGGLNIKLFYIRRALRIFPTSYLVLALTALYGFYANLTEPLYLLGQAFHLTNYEIIASGWKAPIAPFTDVYWSLAVEEHFYLVFPAVFVFISRGQSRERVAAWLLAACAVVLLWRCVLVFGLAVHYDRTYMATDTRIDAILFGCVLALRGNPALDPSRIDETRLKRLWFPLSLVGLLVSLAIPSREFRESVGYSIQGLCLFPVFVTVIRYPDWGVVRFLNLRPVRWIGVLSFAIYLVHPAMLALSKAIVGRSFVGLTLTATVLTLAAAAALYYGIERPLGRMRRRFNAGAASGETSAATTPAGFRPAP